MLLIYSSFQGRIQDFPLGGANPHWRGHQPPTQVLFSENICKNERIWSCWGGGGWAPETFVCRSATAFTTCCFYTCPNVSHYAKCDKASLNSSHTWQVYNDYTQDSRLKSSKVFKKSFEIRFWLLYRTLTWKWPWPSKWRKMTNWQMA